MFDLSALKPMKMPPMAEVSNRRAASGSTLLAVFISGGILYGFHLLRLPKEDVVVDFSPSEVGLVASFAEELPTEPPEQFRPLVSMPKVFPNAVPPSSVTLPMPEIVAPPSLEPMEPIKEAVPEPFDFGTDILHTEWKFAEEKEAPKVVESNPKKETVTPKATRPASTSPPKRPDVKVAASRVYTPSPSYPSEARRRGQEGTVYLRLSVGVSGRVSSVSIGKSSGIASLDAAASRAVSKWKFRAATLNGNPVASNVVVPIKFALK